MNGETERQASGAKHLVIVSMLVSTIFSLLLGIGLGVVGAKAISAGHEAKAAAVANAQLIHDACVSTNKSRTADIELWSFVLTITPPADHDAGAALLEGVKERNQLVVCI